MPFWPCRSVWARWSAVDVAWAIGLCVLAQIEVVHAGLPAGSVVAAAVATLPVAVRGRAPLPATALIAAAPLLDALLGGRWTEPPTYLLALLLMAYWLAAHATWRQAVGGWLLLVAGAWVAEYRGEDRHDFLLLAVLIALPWVAGRGVRAYREQTRQLAVAAAQLEVEREVSARLAVAEERQRMARGLHNVIAQAVSRMVVVAAGAEQAIPVAPDRAGAALRAVQDTGRDVINELRRTLHILRTDDPQPEPPAKSEAPAWEKRSARWPRWSSWTGLVLSMALVLSFDAGALLIHPADPAAYATIAIGAAVACVAVALRRRLPRAALTVAVVDLAVQPLLIGPAAGAAPLVAALLATYTVAAYTPAAAAALSIALSYVGLVPVVLVAGMADQIVPLLAWFAVGGGGGLAVRVYRRRAERLQTLTARLARERDARARLAVVEERSRVARELHDSVAHAVSVMVLQAGAAEQVLPAAPDRARTAVRAVEQCGRQALGELQQLLGVLHPDEDPNPRAPRPNLTNLDTLIARARQAGLPVDLQIRGRPGGLPAGVGLSAYRIIQEGLTNAVKHAGRARTTITVDYTGDAVAVEIRNTGPAGPATPAGTGHGLLGMRERVALYGGDLHHGPHPGGGYTVRARLPLTAAPA